MGFTLEDFEARKQQYANRPAKVNPAENISIIEQFSAYDAMEYEQKNSPYNQEWKALTAFGNGIKTVGRGLLKGITMLQDINTQAHRESDPNFQLNPAAQAVRDASDADILQETPVAASSGLGQFGLDLASGAGQLIPSLAVAPLTGGYGAALVMGASVAGNEYDELREKGIGVDTASTAAFINAGIQTPLEFIGFSKLFGKLPVGSVTKGFIREFAERVATEGITEAIQEYPEAITKIWAENADKSPEEIVGIVKDQLGDITADAAYSGVIGGILGGGVAGAHMTLARDSWQNRIERNIHEGKMDIVERQINDIVESDSNPVAAAAVIDSSQQQSVYVDAGTVVNYAQEHGVAINDLAQSLGVEAQAIKNAATEGDYIDVSLGRYEAASAKHNGFFQAVKDDTSFEDGGYTVNNDKLRQEAMAKAKEQAKTMDRNVAEALQVEKDSMLTGMLTAGMSRTQANLAMEILTARAKVVNPENPAEALKQLKFQMGGQDNILNQMSENKAKGTKFGKNGYLQNIAEKNGYINPKTARGKLKTDIQKWKQVLKDMPKKVWREKSAEYKKSIKVMDTPLVLQMIGVPYLPVHIKQGKINRIRLDKHPEITDSILEQIPGGLSDPLAVVASSTRGSDSIVVILSLKDASGVNVIVPIEIANKDNEIELNIISSVYGRGKSVDGKRVLQSDWFDRTFSDVSNVYYLNRKKVQPLKSLRVQFPGRDINGLDLFDTPSILHEEDLVNEKKLNSKLYQGGSFVKGSFNPVQQDGQYVINLFKGADASTVIHETGHYFVETMWQAIVDGQASEQTQKDFDILLDYAGMTREQWAAADVEGRRDAHERLAEAFESYIMEGKAPSEQLKQAFKKFADWLKAVYQTIRRSENSVPLTDEVRGVFDRMLAAEEDIAEAERINRYFANLPKVITDNMSDATKARVESFIEKARDKAVNILTRDAMANYREDRKKDVEAYRAEILPEVEAEVAERRVYKAGYSRNDVRKYQKLVQNDAGRELTDEEQVFVMQFELTAESYGYTSASELGQDIMSSITQKQAVTRAANDRVNARFPDIMADQQAHEEAVREALYNDDTGLLIGVEQQLIEEYTTRAMESQKKREPAQQSGKNKPKAIDKTKEEMRIRAAAFRQASRNMAREAIYRLTIDDAVRTQKYAALERKAAMKSAAAMAKKDYREALTQKNLQAYYLAMVQESILAKRLVDKNRRYLKRQVAAKREAWVSNYHFAEASMLFTRMGIAQKKHDTYGRVGNSLREYADAMNEKYDCAEFAEWLLNTPDMDMLSDTKMFTLDQFNDLTNAVRNIRAIAKAEKGEKMFEKAESFDALKQQIIANIKVLPEVFKPDPNQPTQAGLFDKMKASMENIDTFFERMDNWKQGFFIDTFLQRIKHSNDTEFTFKEKFDQAVVDANKVWLPDKAAKAAAAQEVYFEELGASVNKYILTKMLMNMGNKENAQRLCETPPIGFENGTIWVTPENSALSREQARELTHQNLMDFLGKVLTEQDVAYAQKMVNAAGLFWSEKNEMEKRVKGFGLKKVEAAPQILDINGKNVVFQGGYFPLMRNGEMGSHPASKEVGDDDPLQGKNIRTLHTNTGSTKSRVAGVKYPVNLFPGAEMQVIYDSIHDLCWRETMNDFRRVLNDGDIFIALKTHLGPARMRVFREMLEKAAQPQNTYSADMAEQTVGAAMSWLRNKSANAIIMMNLKVNMQNLGNIFLFGNSVEGFTHADTIAALGNYKMNFADAEGYADLTDFIFSKSAFMRERMLIPDVTVRDIRGDIAQKQTEFDKAVMRVGTKMMAFTDGLTAKPVWLQAYQKALNSGKTEQDAVDFADTIIRRTLGSSRVTDVSSLQRGGAVYKLLTMFQSFFNTQYNQWVREAGKDSRLLSEGKKREAYESAFSFFMAKFVLTCLASSALALKNPFDRDDDDGWLEILKEMKNYTFGMLGPAGQVGSVMVGNLLGMKEFGYRMSVVQSSLEKGIKLTKTANKATNGKASAADVAEGVTDVAGFILGAPAQINKVVWNLYDIMINDMKPRLSDFTTRRSKNKRDE